MTKNKRFTMDEDGNVTDTVEDRTLYVENKYTECKYFTNLLNELHDENQRLKLENDGLRYALKNIKKIDVEIRVDDLND